MGRKGTKVLEGYPKEICEDDQEKESKAIDEEEELKSSDSDKEDSEMTI